MSRLRARRGGFRGRVYVAPRPAYVEPAPATCCACCGNRIDDGRCIACAPRPSANAGELGEPAPPGAAAPGVFPAQAQGIGAGAILLLLALVFATGKDRALF